MMAAQIRQDIAAGRAVACIDPKGGDLIDEVLAHVPDNRRDDVVIIDPSRTDRVTGINVLQMGHGEQGAELAVDHLVHLMNSL